MTTLTNKTKQMLAVSDAGKHKEISPGATIEVDGGQNWGAHLFVKAEWLTVSGDDSDEGAGGDDDALTVEDITEEGGEFTVRASDGVEFSPPKNQVREDGTLTNGGMKAYEEAKAAQQPVE